MALLIRLAREDDAGAIASIYRPYVEASRISFEEVAPDSAEIARRMTSPQHPWLALEEDGRLAGYCVSSPYHKREAYRWTVETGIYLTVGAQGRGLGRTLLVAMLELLTRQGYATAIGTIALPNDASIALHEKVGFEAAGMYRSVGFKLGQWVDVGRWQKQLAQRDEAPAEPLPFSGLL
jgi:L-amino acid N-acyltransferase YncA